MNRHMQSHIRRQNSNTTYPCCSCPLVFIYSSHLEEHICSPQLERNAAKSLADNNATIMETLLEHQESWTEKTPNYNSAPSTLGKLFNNTYAPS